jgi:tRNA pseudouridine38-40 synthase
MAETCLRKVFGRVEYLGTGYSGWQTQRNSPVLTISGAIEQSLSAILPTEKCTKFILVGASRTDAGVSAASNAFHLKLYYSQGATPLPDKFFRLALNTQLSRNSHSIRILETKEVPYGFHAQRTVRKMYRYTVTTDNSVFAADRAMVIPTQLDVELVKGAGELLTGWINAQGFSKRHKETDPPERLITAITVETKGKDTIIDFISAGFAWHQVRYMAGCMIECGLHRKTLAQVQDLASGRCVDRPLLAPAAGLCLQRVEYDPFWGV